MKKPITTICITCFNDSDFILTTLYCLERLTKNGYKVIIRDNDSEIEEYNNLKENVKKYHNVKLYRVENMKNYHGSMALGIAFNDLVSQIDTPYGVLLDADCTFLHKNWDEILIKELNEDYPLIGTPHAAGGRKMPYKTALMFKNEIMQYLKLDFRPIGIPDDEEAFLDTAYQIEEKYAAAGHKGKILEWRNTRNYKKGPFKNILAVAEYYLDGYERIFASHFGRGATLGKNRYINIHNKWWRKKIYTFPKVGKYLLTYKAKKAKKKWIKICKKIANKVSD